MAEPAVPRVTWEDWYAWSMDQFGGDAQLAHPAARSGREALDVGATQEAATRAALSAAEAGRDKPNTAELQPQAKSAWVKKPSPSEPDADAVSSGPPNKEDSANASVVQPPEASEPPSAASDVAARSAPGLSPGEEPTSARPGRTPNPAAQPIVSPDGTQILINRAWYSFPGAAGLRHTTGASARPVRGRARRVGRRPVAASQPVVERHEAPPPRRAPVADIITGSVRAVAR
jgi:hypothetical protein